MVVGKTMIVAGIGSRKGVGMAQVIAAVEAALRASGTRKRYLPRDASLGCRWLWWRMKRKHRLRRDTNRSCLKGQRRPSPACRHPLSVSFDKFRRERSDFIKDFANRRHRKITTGAKARFLHQTPSQVIQARR
jgi:hypothetical protein